MLNLIDDDYSRTLLQYNCALLLNYVCLSFPVIVFPTALESALYEENKTFVRLQVHYSGAFGGLYIASVTFTDLYNVSRDDLEVDLLPTCSMISFRS